jgi:hypothetical protein
MAKLNKAGRVAASTKRAANREANKVKPAARKNIKDATKEGMAVAKAERSRSSSTKKITWKAGASGRNPAGGGMASGKSRANVGESFNYGSDNARKTRQESSAYTRGKKKVEAKGAVESKFPRRKPNAKRDSANAATFKSKNSNW